MTNHDPVALAGIFPVIQTPFADDDGQGVDHDGISRLVADQLSWGADGLVALGVGSETSALTEAERDTVLRSVRAAAGTGPTVVCGIDGATVVAVERAIRAKELGADVLMVLPPPGGYGHDAVVRHLGDLAHAAELPIVLQDAPQVSGKSLGADALATLVHHSTDVVAIKLEGADALDKIADLAPRGIPTISGWGGVHFPQAIDAGAVGCFPGSDLGPAFVQLLRSSDRTQRDRIYELILPLLVYLGRNVETLIAGCKYLLLRRGLITHAGVRRPARELTERERHTLDTFSEHLSAEGVAGFTQALDPGPRLR
ncbi:MAG: dihydrodipicolinate synthase family protein [Gaiellales bacterium]